MYSRKDFDKPFYKTGYVAKLVGLHVRTIQSYCDSGVLESMRTDSGLRLIPKASLLHFLKSLHLLQEDRKDVAYALEFVSGFDNVYIAPNGLESLMSDILSDKVDSVTFTDDTKNDPFVGVIKKICDEHDVNIKGE